MAELDIDETGENFFVLQHGFTQSHFFVQSLELIVNIKNQNEVRKLIKKTYSIVSEM